MAVANKITQINLTYCKDSALVAMQLKQLPWLIWFDSCNTDIGTQQVEILAADPYIRITAIDRSCTVTTREQIYQVNADPLALLQELMPDPIEPLLPHFNGGAAGYIGYDYVRNLEALPALSQSDIQVPQVAFGLYDWVVRLDHQQKTSQLICHHQDPESTERLALLLPLLNTRATPETLTYRISTQISSNLRFEEYQHAFQTIKNHIAAGDTYQINFAQRFQTHFEGSSLGAYLQLRQKMAMPFSLYFQLDDAAILSFSPERFVKLQGKKVCAQPIKGTCRRDPDPNRDLALAQALPRCDKNRAENVMIVDLLRNDFSKFCVSGSIEVPKLFELQSFSSVHHLVSTITGNLRPELNYRDVLSHTFPCGSVTGTPKIRAMEIIEALEPHRRAVYCGSIGYIDYSGDMDFNVAIRTILIEKQALYCYAGGGIVADSECELEYQESFDKISLLLQALRSDFCRAQ